MTGHRGNASSAMGAIDVAVEVAPSEIVKRRAVAWRGMAAEIVQATRRERVEYRFRAPFHLLAVHDYFYFDPARMPLNSESGAVRTSFAPRLFFEDAALRETALKLATLIETEGDNRPYLEALGAVLTHELARLNQGTPDKGPPVRGGLAAWQDDETARTNTAIFGGSQPFRQSTE